jgi:PAS domain S-box-containing protein
MFAQIDSVVVWSTTDSDTLEYLSPGFESLWGTDPESVRGEVSTFLRLVHPEAREEIIELMQTIEFGEPCPGGALQPIEYRIVRPDGDVRWVETRFSGIEDDDDNLLELIGVTIDVSERKRREQKIEVLTRLLRHDVYTDVSAVLGWLETLRDSVTGNQRSLVDRAQSASQHAIELTEVAREYVDVVTDEEEEFSLRPVTASSTLHEELEAAKLLHPEATFEIEGEFVTRSVRGNELLASVYRNVLNNAVQHNDRASPHVVVSMTSKPSAVVVRIADNGPGIPPETRQSIFEGTPTEPDRDATGMGLYLCRKTVGGFGGRLWIEDEDPRGTVVCIELPLWEPAVGA